MFIGLTKQAQERGKYQLQRRRRAVFNIFCLIAVVPFLIWILFRLDFLRSTPVFSVDIQQPVARLRTRQAVGTAFLVSPTKLLTARHVLEGLKAGDQVQLDFEKSTQPRTLNATVLYIAQQREGLTPTGSQVSTEYFLDDVAVLEVPAISDITPLEMGSSAAVSLLDEVILIGYRAGDYCITKGSINSDKYRDLDLFKLDAAANPGNSGGPCLLKEDHSVIGILVGGGEAGTQGGNIAIKIDLVKTLLRQKGIDLAK